MANSDDSNGVKLIWKITNFSSFKSGVLSSPHFPWNSTTWEIIIDLTDATTYCDSLKVKLRQLYVKGYLWNCSLSFLDSRGFPLVWQNNCYYGSSSNYLTKIKYSETFGSRKNDFLPNDILTIQCHIWKKRNLFIEHHMCHYSLSLE